MQKRVIASVLGKKCRHFLGFSFGAVILVIAALAWYQVARIPSSGEQSLTSDESATVSTLQAAIDAISHSSQKAADANKQAALPSVVTIVQRISGTSQFNALFKSTGVIDRLTGKGPYTIFVPTNSAISQLPPGTISGMTPAQKIRFVQYHVIAGRRVDSEAQAAGTIQALSGDTLNFSYGADKVPLVNSAIFLQKYEASNGVVYLIDNVLLPPLRSR